jgi:hypothetical protein
MMANKAMILDDLANGRGCLGRAANDEPLFVLRAQDLIAAPLIRLWADWAGRMNSPKHLDALAVADEFDRWARTHPDRMKWPD